MDTLSDQGLTTTAVYNPFPGLRPFLPNEAHLFFGREGQSEQILESLAKSRFSAILGASGSGKSSLIYCGLLPILYGGFLHNGRSKWHITITRPGADPVGNLAHSLANTLSKGKSADDIDADAYINQALLYRSAEGISNVINQSDLKGDENVLILVDQFEELFRYQYSGKDANALDKVDHFVNLLVSVVKQVELPVYVVITMRSDFIGDCSPFQEFTKLINDSNYLIPRMTRNDFRMAITGPVAVGGGTISEQLVQLLLNEMGNNPDHLPVLQHALMRTWDYWTNHSTTTNPMGIVEYEAIGRLDRALSNHANEAYDELSVEQKRICEIIFKSLTEKGADNRGVRRPTSVAELAAIAQCSPSDIISVVEVFRMKGRTFLTPSSSVALDDKTLIDISHESIMRVWDKLKIWVDEESAAVKMYLRLAESADMYSEGRTTLWGPPDLQLALSWREKQKPSLAWAARYHPAFERTMVYLRTSEEEYIAEEQNKIRLQKRALRRSRIVALILGTAGMISIGLGILALMQRQDALLASNKAIEQEKIAKTEAEEAKRQRELAVKNEKEALAQKELAEENRKQADIQRQRALQNLNEADRQRVIANEKSIEAQEQQKRAEANAQKAIEQQRLAEQASLEAERRRMLSIAQSMAVKSQQMRVDTLLKGLLAFQAYKFNSGNNGIAYNPDIYRAIYLSTKYFKGDGFNRLEDHKSIVRTFLTSDNSFYSSGSDGMLINWDFNSKAGKILLSNQSIILKIAERDGKLVGLTNTGYFTYNLQTAETQSYSDIPLDLKDFYYTTNGKLVQVFNQLVDITDGFNQKGREVYRTNAKINATKFDKNTNTLFVALSDGSVVLLKNLGEANQSQVDIARVLDSNWGELGYCSQRNLLVAGFGSSQGAVYVWNAKTGQQLSILRGHNAKITSIAFSPNAQFMATASYDGTLRLWRLDDLNTLPIVFDDHDSWVTATIFSPDNKYVISGDKNGNIRLYPVEVELLVADFCPYLQRKLSVEEWKTYVGEDIPYSPEPCN